MSSSSIFNFCDIVVYVWSFPILLIMTVMVNNYGYIWLTLKVSNDTLVFDQVGKVCSCMKYWVDKIRLHTRT